MKIDIIAGARPNFVKIAALITSIYKDPEKKISFRLIHTGQHYDASLSESFFKQLNIPEPDINFGVGSGSQAQQTAFIMKAYEELLEKEKPSLTVVVGDVTSSMACAITAKKMQVRIAHIEAGLRSYDWSMPEEVNRVLIDSIADYFFTTTPLATQYLIDHGFDEDNIYFVGNTMIDTLKRFQPKFKKPEIWNQLDLKDKDYLIITLHRPGNLKEGKNFKETIIKIIENSRNLSVIFPAHPRTQKIIEKLGIKADNFYPIPPLSYFEFNYLVERAKLVITDSGGVTEETTILNIPCLTLRENTERPETVSIGTNELVGRNHDKLVSSMEKVFSNNWKTGKVPDLWDGQAGERIVNVLKKLY